MSLDFKKFEYIISFKYITSVTFKHKKKFDDLAIVLVTYKTTVDTINKIVEKIPKEIQVLITENSKNLFFKKKIERKFKNVTILIPKNNLGNGGGINFCINNSDKKYYFYLDIDTCFEKSFIKNFFLRSINLKNWAIAAPAIKDYNYPNKDFNEKLEKDIWVMNRIIGCALLFNAKEFKEIGFYDENIFLFFEEDDIFEKLKINNKRIILLKSEIIKHIGNNSAYKKRDILRIEMLKNWHLMWSKFYFYNKYKGKIFAYLITIKQFISSFLKMLILLLLGNKEKATIYKYRFDGLLSAYTGKKSYKRINNIKLI